MRKCFKIQRAAMWAFFVMAVVMFLYALAFMTDYKDLFGLKTQLNAQIAEFHDVTLQTFNQQIFAASLVGVLVILVSRLLEIPSKVPDVFALAVLLVLLGWIAWECVSFYGQIDGIQTVYENLDFSYYYLEGPDDYALKFTTFSLGQKLYLAEGIVCGLYGLALLASHVSYRIGRRRGDEQ